MKDIMPYSKLNGNEFERISAEGENFSPLLIIMISNWINDLNSKTLDDNIFPNETNCNYFTIDEFKDLNDAN